MENLAQILLLLVISVSVILAFQRLRIPTPLGYLLVGLMLGPFTIGPAVYMPEFRPIAEFGVVFLLFTVGLNYSLPQLNALRHQILGLGTGQVVLTTILAGLVVWLAGLPGAEAFVFGAVFAQSSTTIIGSLLNEQGEENSQHGRLGLAMSVFQDVTAVPFLVIIPVLGAGVSALALSGALSMAFIKATLAFLLVFFMGRWLLRPLFHLVAARRSAEVFTLAVLAVALMAAWITDSFGLSLAFGGFLAGMMLGETEFRHQIESSIRPFRDVLLGLFFVGIGMRIDPLSIPPVWHWTVLGALLILSSKILIVTLLMRFLGNTDWTRACRTGLLLAVGGEFGLALVAIALDSNVLQGNEGQVAITAVLLAMILGALLIRFNGPLVSLLLSEEKKPSTFDNVLDTEGPGFVVIGGYGRVGHTIAVLLASAGKPFIAFDTDPERVAQGRKEGHAVSYGDIADPEILNTIHADRASMIILTIDEMARALRAVQHIRRNCPQVPVVARARDALASRSLRDAGASHAYPETIEASLHLGETAMRMLNIPEEIISEGLQEVRDWGYQPVLQEPKRKTLEPEA